MSIWKTIWKKPDEAVPRLLARLQKARCQVLQGPRTQCLSTQFDEIEEKINSMRHVCPQIRSLEERIMDEFCDLEKKLDADNFSEKELYADIYKDRCDLEQKLDADNFSEQELCDEIYMDQMMKSKRREKLDFIKNKVENLKQSFSEVKLGTPTKPFKLMDLPAEGNHHNQTVCEERKDLRIEDKILESNTLSSFYQSFHCLGSSQQVQMCSLCLAVFPLNSVIEKKPLVYWWIGEGLVMKSQDKTAEEVGELVFKELLNQCFIRPSDENKSLSVNSFIVDPWIHRMLILMAKKNSFLEFSSKWTPCNGIRRAFLSPGNGSYSMMNGEKEEDLLTVFNVNEQYLRMKPEWLDKLKKVEVLHLGRWRHSATHHIEVENQTLLNGLGSQKRLKYLSLRGISRIETLPPSISKLISLQILDMRACHNLEKLPRQVSRLKNLTHLDVSECYLLDSMPKGLEQLNELQVLKGFVIGKANKTSCKISDLARLNKLRKLSIRVGETEKQDNDQLGNLSALSTLHILTISWGDISLDQGKPISLPPKLTKLDLRCVPFLAVPSWLKPSNLPSNLEKLYIKGGKLKSLEHEDGGNNWKFKYIRLKYLKNLEIDEDALDRLFPYVEKSCRQESISNNITLNR